MNYKLFKKQNYFHAVFEKKGVEIINRDGKEVVKISGYASTVDKDRVGDVVLPSAFMNTLAIYKQNPVILLQHKMDKPIGRATDLKVDEKGLYIEAEITEDIDGCISAIKNEVLKGFSIGYRVKDWEEKGNEDGIYFEIKEVELLEISVVSVPANPFTLIKSLEDCFIKENEEIEQKEEEKKEEETPTEEKQTQGSEDEKINEENQNNDSNSEQVEKVDEISTNNEVVNEPQEEKGNDLKEMSFKMLEKRLEATSSEMKVDLEKSLSEILEKALGDKAESIKSSLLDEVNQKFTEYSKGQEELLTIVVDTMKSFDKEMNEMLSLVKALRSSKGYNYEKPIEVKETRGDKLSKALSLAKKI